MRLLKLTLATILVVPFAIAAVVALAVGATFYVGWLVLSFD